MKWIIELLWGLRLKVLKALLQGICPELFTLLWLGFIRTNKKNWGALLGQLCSFGRFVLHSPWGEHFKSCIRVCKYVITNVWSDESAHWDPIRQFLGWKSLQRSARVRLRLLGNEECTVEGTGRKIVSQQLCALEHFTSTAYEILHKQVTHTLVIHLDGGLESGGAFGEEYLVK